MKYEVDRSEFEQLKKAVTDLKAEVAMLRLESGEYLCYATHVPAGAPTRRSAMQGVNLILKHLGLRFKDIMPAPARTELAPLDTIKIGKRSK